MAKTNPFDGDDRATDLMAANTDDISALASQFSSTAETAHLAASALRSTQASDWTGESEVTYNLRVQYFPQDLDRVHRSYTTVATAMNTFANAVSALQTQYYLLQSDYSTAVGTLGKARTTAASAKQSLQVAQANPYLNTFMLNGGLGNSGILTQDQKPVPPSITVNGHTYYHSLPPYDAQAQLSDAELTHRQAQSALSSARHAVNGYIAKGNTLLDTFDTDRTHLHNAINGAKDKLPKDPSQGGFINWAGGLVTDFANYADDVGSAAYHLPGALGHLITHLNDPEAWSKFGEDLGTVAGAVAVALAIAACPADSAALDPLIEAADTTATAGAVIKTGGDTTKLIQGDGSVSTVLGDAAVLGFAGATTKVGEDAKGAAESSEDALNDLTSGQSAGLQSALKGDGDGISQYNMDKALGESPEQAYLSLSGPQQAELNDAVTRLSDPKDFATMQSVASQASAHESTVIKGSAISNWLADQARGHLAGSDVTGEPGGGDGGTGASVGGGRVRAD